MDYKNVLKNFLDQEDKLILFPAKRKMKLIALLYLSSKIEKGKCYTEEGINKIINDNCCFNDPATIRRELYQNRFMNRLNDGKMYWLEDKQPTFESLGIII